MASVSLVNKNFKSEDDELDFIFELVDTLCWMGNWTLLDAMLAGAEPEKMTATIACGYASITHCVKDKLPSRKEYIQRCKKAYPEKDLWSGFERD